MRSLAQADLGLSRRISASAGFVSAPVAGEREQFARVGLRTTGSLRISRRVGETSVRDHLDYGIGTGEGTTGADAGEQPLPGAGFTVDGGRRQARTDGNGIAYLNHLPIQRQVNIGVNSGTLADPQWGPQQPGLSLVPRPGRVGRVRLASSPRFTIQLMAAGSEATVQAYIERHQLQQKAVCSRTMRDGRQWYVVLYGAYARYDDAMATLRALPPALTGASPWVRPYGGSTSPRVPLAASWPIFVP